MRVAMRGTMGRVPACSLLLPAGDLRWISSGAEVQRCRSPPRAFSQVAWFFVKLYLVEVARPDGKVPAGGL